LKSFYGIENATCLKPFGKEAEVFIDLCMPQIHTRIMGDSNSILRLNLTISPPLAIGMHEAGY